MAIIRASVLILYGSETGNAQDKAEEIDRMCQRLHCHTELKAMDDTQLGELLTGYDLVCFVLSTTGQGHFPSNARTFWRSLRRAKLPPQCLATVRFTTFGLGDSAYHKFNWASRLLNSRLRQLGAAELFHRGEADERHDEGVDSIYQPWLKEFRQFLVDTFPVPSYVKPMSDEEALPPRFTLRLKEEDDSDASSAVPAPIAPPDFPPPVLLPHPNTVDAVVVANDRVTPASHWQDVRLLQLDVSQPPAAYELLPGDRVVIYPKNYPEDVQTLIRFMEWEAVADKPVELGLKRPNGLYPPASGGGGGCTLRELLTHNIDFMAVPSRSFLHKLAFYTSHPDQREKLFELVQPEGAQDFYDFTSRPRRTILEVLHEFYTARVPYEAVPDIFPVIRGREFSIANGGEEWQVKDKAGVPARRRLDILAALVEYRTIIRKPRVGFCSRYLAKLPVGTPLRVELKRETPPPHDRTAAEARPLIGIATGTGIAPVRSLIHDRSRFVPRAETLLFFGCRSRAADFYFAKEWENTEQLTVVPAFSRDPATAVTVPNDTPQPTQPATPQYDHPQYDHGKSYVQHEIRRHAADVCRLLARNAVIVLCGNSGRMPTSVREALREAAVAGGFCADTDEAERVLFNNDSKKDGSGVVYWEETW